MDRLALIAGTANPPLAAAVAAALGVAPIACAVERFPDGELAVHLAESVRGAEVFLVQPTAPPVNDHLVELLALADACRRASAGASRRSFRTSATRVATSVTGGARR